MRRKKDTQWIGSSSEPQDLALSLYLKDIAKTKPLSSKEEAELTLRIRNNNQEALHKLITANLRFVVSVANAYQNQGVPLIDIINEGNLGLIEAAKRFDERKNFRFISYAVWWIRQAILQLLAERSRIVRMPLNRAGTLHKIGVVQRKLEQKLQRYPTSEEIASELNTHAQEIQALIAIGGRHASLDAMIGNDAGSLHDVLPSVEDEDNCESRLFGSALTKEIERMLGILSEREQKIIKLSFGIGVYDTQTLEEISSKLSITRERVRQIRETALAKLQRSSLTKHLQIFLQH